MRPFEAEVTAELRQGNKQRLTAALIAEERAGNLSPEEVRYMLQRMEPEHPDVSFDPIAHDQKVERGLVDLVMHMPSGELLEFLSEMDDESKIELRRRMLPVLLVGTDAAAQDLGRFIERLFDKYNRPRVEAAMERNGE